jgi:hypothetical protein
VLEHLQQLERIEAAATARRAATAAAPGAATRAASAPQQRRPSAREQSHVSWVEHSTSTAGSLLEGMMFEGEESSSEDEALEALRALPLHSLTDAQQAAIVLSTWESAAHTKPEGFDAGAQLTMPGLAGAWGVERVGLAGTGRPSRSAHECCCC